MVRVRLKGINKVPKVLADGTKRYYYYHRATGRPLRGEPGSSEFVASLAEAENFIRNSFTGTFSALVREFTLSIEFQQNLAPSTQIEYRRMLTASEAHFGDLPILALSDFGIRNEFLNWRDKVARTSGKREADNRLSAISAMLTWALDRGKIEANNLKGFKRLYQVDRSEIIWLPAHISAFMSVAPIQLQWALILALHTGQREGDLLRLPWSSYDGHSIKLRQSKSRRRGKAGPLIEIPCTSLLKQMLNGMDRKSPLILTTKTGKAFKKRYFIRLWDDAMKKAGLQHVNLPGLDDPVELHFHDLRGTAVTLIVRSGQHASTDRNHHRTFS